MANGSSNYLALRGKVLATIALLKSPGGSEHWARSLEGYVLEANGDMSVLADRVLGNYGSMGALNDFNFAEDESRNAEFNTLIAEMAELGAPFVTNDRVKHNATWRGSIARKLAEHEA